MHINMLNICNNFFLGLKKCTEFIIQKVIIGIVSSWSCSVKSLICLSLLIHVKGAVCRN